MTSSAARSASVTGEESGFAFDLEAAADELEDRLAGVARRLADVVEEALAIHVSAAPSGCRRRAAPRPR